MKVLIAEDHESSNISVRKTLEDLAIAKPDPVYYCDLALARVRKALQDGAPYDLLITDISFDADGSPQQLADGPALIAAARELQPDLRVLVFSIEKKVAVIDNLYGHLHIDGYVSKGRNDVQELKVAIGMIAAGKTYFPPGYRHSVKQMNAHDFTAFDLSIIGQLLDGTLQKDIPAYLEAHGIKPSKLSSVEKRLKLMKNTLGFSNNEQLVACCKDLGII